MRRLAPLAVAALFSCAEPIVGFPLDSGEATGGGRAGGVGGGGGGAAGGAGGGAGGGAACLDTACTNPPTSCYRSPGTCPAGVCMYSPLPATAPCVGDTNPCTTDHCDGAGHCIVEPNDAGCDDGNTCTRADICQLGRCDGQTNCVNVPPGECFVVASCGGNGICSFAPRVRGVACGADVSSCTDDYCDGDGGCVHPQKSAGASCATDNLACTDDLCDGLGTCLHRPACPVVVSDCFSSAGTCGADGGCAYAALPSSAPCPADNNDCTADHCDGAGTCVHTAVTPGTLCPDDGLPCTFDVCAGTTCGHPARPTNVACPDDGRSCTSDFCAGDGGCGHPVFCNAPGKCEQLPGTCNGAGSCRYQLATAGTGCTGCTGLDSCHVCSCDNGGQCLAANVMQPCPDGDGLGCTDGFCGQQGANWTCLPQDSCTPPRVCSAPFGVCRCPPGQAFAMGMCVSCGTLANGQCGANTDCDGQVVTWVEPGSGTGFPSTCASSLGACSASNAQADNTAASNMFNNGKPRVCIKADGIYGWLPRASSGVPGCKSVLSHCDYICTARFASGAGYSAFCDNNGNWDTVIGDSVADGCMTLPMAGWACP